MGGSLSLRDRGCSWRGKHCSPHRGKGYSSLTIDLTEREKELVRTTWEPLSQCRIEKAVEIFLRIFELAPETKDLFPFRNAVGEALIRHPMFKSHATRFINAVHSTVINLNAWEVILIPTLIQLGRTHTKIPGFKLEHLDIFIRAILDVWARSLGRQWTSETRTAWKKIFCLIAGKVEYGYNQELRDKARRDSLAERASRAETVAVSPAKGGGQGGGGAATDVKCPVTATVAKCPVTATVAKCPVTATVAKCPVTATAATVPATDPAAPEGLCPAPETNGGPTAKARNAVDGRDQPQPQPQPQPPEPPHTSAVGNGLGNGIGNGNVNSNGALLGNSTCVGLSSESPPGGRCGGPGLAQATTAT